MTGNREWREVNERKHSENLTVASVMSRTRGRRWIGIEYRDGIELVQSPRYETEAEALAWCDRTVVLRRMQSGDAT